MLEPGMKLSEKLQVLFDGFRECDCFCRHFITSNLGILSLTFLLMVDDWEANFQSFIAVVRTLKYPLVNVPGGL